MKKAIISKTNKRFLLSLLGATSLLFIPLLAMQITSEIKWSAFDFFIMGIMLLTLIIGIEFFFRKIKSRKNRILILGLSLALFFLIWAEMAVGIFNSPISGT